MDLQNNNNNIEQLFWKVFHNKYIFNEIFKQMENEIIEYNCLTKYYSGNRKKFKYLTDLKWFLEKRQFNLLKYKLKQQLLQPNIEKINLDFNSIVDLLKNCKDRELLKLFYINYSNIIKNQFHITDFIIYGVQTSNLDSITVFIQDFSYECSLYAITEAISKRKTEIIPILLKSLSNTVLKTVIEFSLEWSIRYNKNRMASFLLNNYPNYYVEEIVSNGSSEQPKNLIGFKELFFVCSNEMKHLLIDNNCVFNDSSEKKLLYINGSGDYNKSELLLYLKVGLKLFTNESFQYSQGKNIEKYNSIIEKNKESFNDDGDDGRFIFESLLNEIEPNRIDDLFYFNYLLKYDQVPGDTINNEHHFLIVQNYIFSNFSCNVLKCYLKYAPIYYKSNNNINLEKMDLNIKFNEKLHKNKIIPFLQLFFSQDIILDYPYWSKVFKVIIFDKCCENCDKIRVLEDIINIKALPSSILLLNNKDCGYSELDFLKYKWYINNIVKPNVEPNQYNKYNSVCFSLSNKDVIEFLTCGDNKLFFNLGLEERSKCLNYQIEKLNLGLYNKQLANRFSFIFNKSLLNCDINTIQYIDSLNLIIEPPLINLNYNINGNIKFEKPIEQVVQLFSYLNETSYKSFSQDYFHYIINDVLEISFPRDEIYSEIKNIPFHRFIQKSINILFLWIQKLYTPLVKMILEDSNLGNSIGNLKDIEIFQYDRDARSKKVRLETLDKNQIIDIINYLINSKNMLTILNQFQFITKCLFQYLYNFLIITNGVTLDQVKEINQLFQRFSIEIDYEAFQIFYWLAIKSTRLTKYFFSKSEFEKEIFKSTSFNSFIFNNTNLLQLTKKVELIPHNLGYYLNLDDFQFEIIYNSTFKELLNLLKTKIYDKFNSDLKLNKSKLSKAFEDEALYLLIIREFDSLLELADKNPNFYLSSTKFQENLFNSLNIKSIEELKKKHFI
ncbi:hypothetical protein ACTFIW_007777 [Dictyostelium discoideum]